MRSRPMGNGKSLYSKGDGHTTRTRCRGEPMTLLGRSRVADPTLLKSPAAVAHAAERKVASAGADAASPGPEVPAETPAQLPCRASATCPGALLQSDCKREARGVTLYCGNTTPGIPKAASATTSGVTGQPRSREAARRRPLLRRTGSLKDEADAPASARGRRYSPALARLPSSVRLEDLILGVKMACLAYTDDEPGTLESLGGSRKAIEAIAGGPEKAREPLSRILAGIGFKADRIFSHSGQYSQSRGVDTQGFIAHNEDDVVLAYRGTTGIVDWLTDLAASTTAFEPLKELQVRSHPPLCERWGRWLQRCKHLRPKAHQGFYEALLASLPDIEAALLPHLRDGKPKRLIIAGHSLGGAIATGALGYLLQRFNFATSPHQLLFVTAGQPRFGDADFVAWLDRELGKLRRHNKCCATRLVNDCDGVPMVPPRNFGFDDCGKLCLLTRDGELFVGPEVEEAQQATSLAECVEEHRTDRYLQLLRAAEVAAA